MRPGEPKKGGGGGMFTWGRVGDASNYQVIDEDSNDPNYDSEPSMEYHDSSLSLTESPSKPAPYTSQVLPSFLTPEYWLFDFLELKKDTRARVDEVFVQRSYSGFISWLKTLKRNKLHSYIFARTVQVALDKTECEYEIAWGLLELLSTAKVFTSRDIRRGFDRIYRNIAEIMIDVPNAPEIVLELLSQTILTKSLSPSAVIRVPSSLYNLGSGSYVLRNVKQDLVRIRDDGSGIEEVVVADFIENIAETKEKIVQIVREYYASGVSEGVIEFIKGNKLFTSIVVRKAVELALDRNNKDKELCSRIIAEISGYCAPETLVEGFDDILWNSKELVIDVPEAGDIISKFLARAIVDDCLPSNYIYEAELMHDETIEISILITAFNLLKPKEAFTSLQSVWGPQASTIEDFKQIFKTIIAELFDSKDLKNTEECLRELSCKYYMHEFVKKILESVMDRSENEEKIVIELLKNLQVRGIITEDQISIGFERVEANLPQLILDVPKAQQILERLKLKLHS